MGLVNCEDLAVSVTVIAETGDRVALQCRLCTHIRLERVEAVELIFEVDDMQHIAGVLVDLHRSWRECDVVVSVVRDWDQCEHSVCCWLARCDNSRSLCRTEHSAVLKNALVLAQAFVAPKEERVVSPDRAADGDTEVVALERG